MFLCDNQWKFQMFSILNFETNFLETKTFFKKLEYRFLVETFKIETHYFHSKMLCQKPRLRQIEWRLQNGLVTESGVLPVTTLFFCKICSSLRAS